MSRTDARCPLPVLVARGDLAADAVHDHRFGECDLPCRSAYVREWLPSTRCRWEFRWSGVGVCACSLCHAGVLHHQDNRNARHRDRMALGQALAMWRGGDRSAFDEIAAPGQDRYY